MLYTNANMKNAKLALFRSNLNGYSTERMCIDTVISPKLGVMNLKEKYFETCLFIANN